VTTPLRPEYVVDAQHVLPRTPSSRSTRRTSFMQFWKPRRTQSMLNS
jgi:acetolactate synthase-1/2/3 large subunit